MTRWAAVPLAWLVVACGIVAGPDRRDVPDEPGGAGGTNGGAGGTNASAGGEAGVAAAGAAAEAGAGGEAGSG